MSLSDPLFSAILFWSVQGLGGAALILALILMPHREFYRRSELQHVFYATTLLVAILWWMRGAATPGMEVHFLGMTAVTLVLGWPLAVITGVLASVCTAAVHLQPWSKVAFEALFLGVVPASLSALTLWLVERFLPKHPFVFILGVSFFGAIVVAAVARILVAGYLILATGANPEAVLGQTRVILLLTSFPEGIINGIAVTVLVVYRPQWVRRFNAERYLG